MTLIKNGKFLSRHIFIMPLEIEMMSADMPNQFWKDLLALEHKYEILIHDKKGRLKDNSTVKIALQCRRMTVQDALTYNLLEDTNWVNFIRSFKYADETLFGNNMKVESYNDKSIKLSNHKREIEVSGNDLIEIWLPDTLPVNT